MTPPFLYIPCDSIIHLLGFTSKMPIYYLVITTYKKLHEKAYM